MVQSILPQKPNQVNSVLQSIGTARSSAFAAMSSLAPVLLFILLLNSAAATEFVYNTDFNDTNVLLVGNATIQSSILTIINETLFSIGRAFYPSKVQTKLHNSSLPLPFSTSFIFSLAPVLKDGILPGPGFVFLFAPTSTMDGATSSQYMGLFNATNLGNPDNHVFAVEVDIVLHREVFADKDGNHLGVDINTLRSAAAHPAGFWGGTSSNEFHKLKLDSGENYQVWIDYKDMLLNVTMAVAGMRKPQKPLISLHKNLSEVFLDEMYVGFCSSTGQLAVNARILAWSFSNTNFSIGDALVTKDLPSFKPKGKSSSSRAVALILAVITLVALGCVILISVILARKQRRGERIEDWELEYWPHRIDYQEIVAATSGFSEANVIGTGGNGKVYRGNLQGVEVAVKTISHEANQGIREFVAEISSLGRLKHRNLVGLRGWSKTKTGSLILVYDYMEHGSLDKRIFSHDESLVLSWKERIDILKNVASGILYLHEGWEVRVLHRDIKASNILLDKDMNARVGDFGLARMHSHHEQLVGTTRVIGTLGYIAPEVLRTGKASAMTDIYGFGILVLEVVCGRRPFEENKPPLIDSVLHMYSKGELLRALDERLVLKGDYNVEEVEKLLQLGLLCASSDPNTRPTMRQIVNVLDGKHETYEAEEGMEKTLLGKLKPKSMWPVNLESFKDSGYPTFEQLTNSNIAMSTSLTNSSVNPESCTILEGR